MFYSSYSFINFSADIYVALKVVITFVCYMSSVDFKMYGSSIRKHFLKVYTELITGS